jgi:hypothetical protein
LRKREVVERERDRRREPLGLASAAPGRKKAAREWARSRLGFHYVYIVDTGIGLRNSGLGQILEGGPYKITASANDLPRRLHYNARLG